jgi:hypothetical protein
LDLRREKFASVVVEHHLHKGENKPIDDLARTKCDPPNELGRSLG